LSLTVAIIGAGPLGRWLALSAARAGFRVLLEDVMPANLHHAREYIRGQLGPDQARVSLPAGKLDTEGGGGFNPRISPEETMGALAPEEQPKGNPPVNYVSTIEDAVREADLAIDCVPDELESKLEILWLLDRMAPPRTVFATPTTRLSIADLAGCTYREGKCVAIAAEARDLAGNSGAEILLRTTARTTPETIALVENFWRRLGFTPTFQQEAAVSGL
jgi:3-hydroxybutyryl-CoA dehydrogenase